MTKSKNKRLRRIIPYEETFQRPRFYDYEKIADELLEWAELETSINLCQFCADRNYVVKSFYDWKEKSPYFRDAWELTKMRLAERRERLLNADLLNYGTWARHAKRFDPFLHIEEEEDLDKEANRRKGIVQAEQANLITLAQMLRENQISQKDKK
jgi:hypothetical protein